MNTNNQTKFNTLGELLLQKISTPTLATAIEGGGIYTWDRFGRFAKACETNKAFILDLLADQYKWETDYEVYVKDSGQHLSPLDKCQTGPQNAEEAEDWDNPFDQFGWPEDAPPDFNNIQQSQIEAEPKNVGKVRRKASDAFIAAFVKLLVEIAKRDSKIDIDALPGTKKDLFSVACKFSDQLDLAYNTFDSYIGGLCKFTHGARSVDYYKDLFPEFF